MLVLINKKDSLKDKDKKILEIGKECKVLKEILVSRKYKMETIKSIKIDNHIHFSYII